jgi:signal peptidase I
MIVENSTTKLEEMEPLSIFEKHILRERRKKSLYRLSFEILITAALVFILFGVIAGIAIVKGDSMMPSLTDGSLALFYRLDSTYERNDIVIFKPSDQDEFLIKRVVAVEGDTVDINNETGELLINGIVHKENTIIGETYKREDGVKFPLIVPRDFVFVMGDNREVALDSRYLGTINTQCLIGKVVFEIKILRD